jgi:hypothetical protein
MLDSWGSFTPAATEQYDENDEAAHFDRQISMSQHKYSELTRKYGTL